MRSIGRAFERGSSSVFSVISPLGGIRPPDRTRRPSALRPSEREQISRGLRTQQSVRMNARRFGPAPSTISREVPGHWGSRALMVWIPHPRVGIEVCHIGDVESTQLEEASMDEGTIIGVDR
ncbi:MAG: helix-turn-helix domain-containing protein [Rhodobacteraceae bacterium]|nr:helix-turn-helix domain-containing protein [Paracoccaceae bacterium]